MRDSSSKPGPAVTPFCSVQYFGETGATLGEDALQFFRLFMAPGVHHCGAAGVSGPGPNAFDMLTPLENWVEGRHRAQLYQRFAL
jgi:hypothetical protein